MFFYYIEKTIQTQSIMARYPRRRRRYRKKKAGASVPLKRVIASEVRTQMRKVSETKVKTQTSLAGSISSSGTIHKLVTIQQGDGGDTRDGENITIKNIVVKGHVNYNAAASATEQVLRIALIKNMTSKKVSDISASDIYNSLGTVNAPYSFRNENFYKDYKVIKVFTFVLGKPSGSGNSIPHYRKFVLAFRPGKYGKVIHHSGATSDLDAKGSYFLHLCSDTVTGGPEVSLNGRTYFVDM